MTVIDTFGRPLKSLRISVTDRCNLRCQYCMPEQEYTWLPRKDLLNFEEISTLVDVFAALGVDKLRITGGEPLLLKEFDQLVAVDIRIQFSVLGFLPCLEICSVTRFLCVKCIVFQAHRV